MKAPCIHIAILIAFLVNTFGPLPVAQASPVTSSVISGAGGDFALPAPGVMVRLSPPLEPPILKGLKVHLDNPFRFDFILDKGEGSQKEQLKQQSTKLIKYFLASLTIPEKDLWVNLSPYEKDRIIPQSFGLTEMGRDLLAEDYMLKQITASLIYPEDEVGKKFWKRMYTEAQKKFGTTNIPVNTFNKVWIVPQKAVVYENAKAGTAYVVEAKLKVMLEQDYLSMSKHADGGVAEGGASPASAGFAEHAGETRGQDPDISRLGSQIIREIVIPELTREVNEDKNFAQLRQVYNSLILATWYKKKIKDSILAQVYEDKKKVAGVEYQSQTNGVETIYRHYLQAFKRGVFNFIKEETDTTSQAVIPRKYFSGGFTAAPLFDADGAMRTTHQLPDSAMASGNEVIIQMILHVLKNTSVFTSPEDYENFTQELVPLTVGDNSRVSRQLREVPQKFSIRQARQLRDFIPSSIEPKSASWYGERFKQAAEFLKAQQGNHLPTEMERVIRLYYALGINWGGDRDVGWSIPDITAISGATKSQQEEDEIAEWLGLDGASRQDAAKLFGRAVELAVRATRIELEENMFWPGVMWLKDSLHQLYLEKTDVDKLKEELISAKGRPGQLAKEREVIKKILKPILGLFTQDVTNDLKCLKRSALMALYLQELGIQVKSVWAIGHIFLMVRLSDGYYMIDPSSNSSTFLSEAFWRFDGNLPDNENFPAQGINIDMQGQHGMNTVYVNDGYLGILGAFYSNFGNVLIDQGQYEQAEQAFRKAIELAPKSSEAYVGLGNALQHQELDEKVQEAKEAYSKAIKLDPKNWKAHYVLGLLLYSQEDYLNAEIEYREALKYIQDKPEIYIDLGWTLIKAKILSGEGAYAGGEGKYAGAEQAFREAIKLAPQSSEAYNGLGMALQGQGFLHGRSQEAYEQAIALDLDNVSAHNNLGLLFLKQRRFDKAAEQFKEAQRLDPENPEILCNVGISDYEQGNFEAAASSFRMAILHDQENPRLYNYLGLAYAGIARAWRSGQPSRRHRAAEYHAVREFQRAVDLYSSDQSRSLDPQYLLQARQNLADALRVQEADSAMTTAQKNRQRQTQLGVKINQMKFQKFTPEMHITYNTIKGFLNYLDGTVGKRRFSSKPNGQAVLAALLTGSGAVLEDVPGYPTLVRIKRNLGDIKRPAILSSEFDDIWNTLQPTNESLLRVLKGMMSTHYNYIIGSVNTPEAQDKKGEIIEKTVKDIDGLFGTQYSLFTKPPTRQMSLVFDRAQLVQEQEMSPVHTAGLKTFLLERFPEDFDRFDLDFDDSVVLQIRPDSLNSVKDIEDNFETLFMELIRNALQEQKEGKITVVVRGNTLSIKNDGAIPWKGMEDRLNEYITKHSLYIAYNPDGSIKEFAHFDTPLLVTKEFELVTQDNRYKVDELFKTPEGGNILFFNRRGVSFASGKNIDQSNGGMGMYVAQEMSQRLKGKLTLADDGRKSKKVIFQVVFSDGSLLTLADHAMQTSKKGGIDLTPANMNLQTQNNGGPIRFHLDPVQLQQLQNALGFVPVIINIQPMTDLKMFLGLTDNPVVDAVSSG